VSSSVSTGRLRTSSVRGATRARRMSHVADGGTVGTRVGARVGNGGGARRMSHVAEGGEEGAHKRCARGAVEWLQGLGAWGRARGHTASASRTPAQTSRRLPPAHRNSGHVTPCPAQQRVHGAAGGAIAVVAGHLTRPEPAAVLYGGGTRCVRLVPGKGRGVSD